MRRHGLVIAHCTDSEDFPMEALSVTGFIFFLCLQITLSLPGTLIAFAGNSVCCILLEWFVIDSDKSAMEKTPTTVVYHEKQSMMLCAIHAVNNLLQSQGAFTKKQFDEICSQ